AVMVSFSGAELRVNKGYLEAREGVHRAIVQFVQGRTRADRHEAQKVILAHPVAAAHRAPVRRPGRAKPEDATTLRELAHWHQEYNLRHFGGSLGEIPIKLSGRMRSRLGQYTTATPYGESAEITISRTHIRKHGWAEALHTLLHEMVHQWQAETGLPIDHGPTFRAKAAAVGIAAQARRELRAPAPAALIVAQHELGLRAARRS
ncbi:MAG: SprT-like domain-containing protein, partial [Gemmatimonadota bacterium]|nr:SprT-like domain-containing protein [Gemmatimonadota bacterium]